MQLLAVALAFTVFLQAVPTKPAVKVADEVLKQLPKVTPTPSALAADEAALKAAHLGTEGPDLVSFFKKRVPAEGAEKAIGALIKQLGDKDEAVQNKAAGELVEIGPTAIAALRVASNGVEDRAACARAFHCLQLIEGAPGATLVRSVMHIIAEKKPDGATEALLDYLPYADNEALMQEVEGVLAAVAVKDGKADPALLKALDHKHPAVRGAVVDILCQVGTPAVLAKVRPLLKDPKPTVRLHAALGLAASNDTEAIPILIQNLGDLEPAQLRQADDVLSEIAGEYAVKAPQGNDTVSRKLRRDLWQAWWQSVDGKVLTAELLGRTLTDADLERAKDLIKQLGNANVQIRDKASTDLVNLGPPVLPLLRQITVLPTSSQTQAALKCMQLIEKDSPNSLPLAAPRLLVLHRPEKTLETLLVFLPFAENETMTAQIIDLIAVVGFRDDKPEPALLAALNDKIAARRSAAVQAIAQGCSLGAGPEQIPGLRKLLTDPDAEVRVRTAQALVGLRDKESVPALINLLTEVPADMAWEVEEVLVRIAGAKTPSVRFAADDATRTKCRDAWTAWWKENGDKIELTGMDLRRRLLGYTLIVEGFDPVKRMGRVTELDAAGKVRWQIDGLQFPTDAQVLSSDRVLIAEQNMNRVTERDLTGKVVWEKAGLAQPFVAQRQRNGNTFIACRNQLMEVDRTGKEVVTLPRFNEYILAATKLRDGSIGYMNNQGTYYHLDAAGKEIKNCKVPFNPQFGINWAEVLPNDHVMITTQANQKITEYDGDGKQVWEATITATGSPTRLPNGNTLVPANGVARVVELDRNGKTVSEIKDPAYRPIRVTRR